MVTLGVTATIRAGTSATGFAETSIRVGRPDGTTLFLEEAIGAGVFNDIEVNESFEIAIGEQVYLDVGVQVSSGANFSSAVAEIEGGRVSFCSSESSLEGRVLLGRSEIPIFGAEVLARDAVTDEIVARSVTDAKGDYCLSGFDTASTVSGANYVISSSLGYIEPTTSIRHSVTNYPDNDPDRRWQAPSNGSGPVSPIVVPDPVFLQGGWNGGLGTWQAMLNFLTDDPAQNPTKKFGRIPAFICVRIPNSSEHVGGYDNDASHVQDHNANGIRLIAHLETLEQELVFDNFEDWGIFENDLPKIQHDIIAHSMGGLITRAMLYAPSVGFAFDAQRKIGRIVCLDSPHGGAKLADFDSSIPALREANLNGISVERDEEPVELGWNAAHSGSTASSPTWLLYSLPDDIVVRPIASAYGIGESRLLSLGNTWTPSGWTQNWLANAPTTRVPVPGSVSHTSFPNTAIHSALIVMDWTAKYLATGERPPIASGLPPSRGNPDPALGLGRLGLEVVAPAALRASTMINLDANTLIYGRISSRGAQSSFRVYDPSGAEISLRSLEQAIFDDGYTLHSFEFPAFAPGAYEVELLSGPTEASELSGIFAFENGRRLESSVTPRTIASADPVSITASLTSASGVVLIGTGGTAEALIVAPDGTMASITLIDDGQHGDGMPNDGVYGNSFDQTLPEGLYSVGLRAQTLFNGVSVERSQEARFVVTPTGAAIMGTHAESKRDDNGDGIAEALEITQGISVTRPGRYRLLAELAESSGALIKQFAETVEPALGQSVATFELSIPASAIARASSDGPWSLQNIQLVDIDAGSLLLDDAPNRLTIPYTRAEFEVPDSPEFRSVFPQSGSVIGGEWLSIRGCNLLDVHTIRFAGVPAEFFVLSDFEISVQVPALRILPVESVGSTASVPKKLRIRIESPWGSVTSQRVYELR